MARSYPYPLAEWPMLCYNSIDAPVWSGGLAPRPYVRCLWEPGFPCAVLTPARQVGKESLHMMGRRPGNPGLRVLAAVVLLITGLLSSGLAPSLAARPAAALSPPTQQDVGYCLGAGAPLMMDIYAPTAS